MSELKICEICGFQTKNGRIFSNHIRWQHRMKDRNSEAFKRFCEKIKEQRKFTSQGVNIQSTEKAFCKKCGKEFERVVYVNNATGRRKTLTDFCSVKCSHSRVWTAEQKHHLSEKAKSNPSGFAKPGWTSTKSARKNHSKRELEIVNFFKENFPADEWKVGLIEGSIRHDGVLVNPDLWSKKLKVVIEYDGVWHFKNIHNQLDYKQKVDKITTKWCLERGYRLIRIDEKLKITNEKIMEAVYKGIKSFECFGSKRYDYLLSSLQLEKNSLQESK